MTDNIYDVIIVGGGPAGLSAGLYAARAAKRTLIFEDQIPGGQLAQTAKVENYPGSAEDTGADIAFRMMEQAMDFSAVLRQEKVVDLNLDGDIKEVVSNKATYKTRAIIFAAGASPRRLGLDHEVEFTGKGISYCSTCDGAFFSGLPVYLVGGGDSAYDEGLFLADIAKSVTIIYRGPKPRASVALQDRAAKKDNIKVILNTNVIKLLGDNSLKGFVIKNSESGKEESIEGDLGLFIFAGHIPNTDLLKDKISLDKGYIPTDEGMRTEIKGLYAAGDIRVKQVRQVATAVSDGVIAATTAIRDMDN